MKMPIRIANCQICLKKIKIFQVTKGGIKKYSEIYYEPEAICMNLKGYRLFCKKCFNDILKYYNQNYKK